MYASPHERLLQAIGEPVLLDTSHDERLSRIFSNRILRTYPSFVEFYGMEDVIDNIVSFLRHAAQGLEEAKQVLYLLGPVGGGKSSLAEQLKELMEQRPFYALKGSPIYESPLGLFASRFQRQALEAHYGIPSRRIPRLMSPWATKRLHEAGGDLSQFTAVKLYPSILNQIAIAKTEPGDENNQDISALVARVQDELQALDRQLQAIPFLDDVDLRYRRHESVPVPISQAVMFCLMDVSGSMGPWEKEMAKRFFMLLYLFLSRNCDK